MDRYYSASQAARLLGTNVPRLLRAVDRLGLTVREERPGKSPRIEIDPDQFAQLRSDLGVTAPTRGRSRVEMQVLAALARAPLGLLSARSVARRASVSPTAAAKALSSLARQGLVFQARETAALGRARHVDVWHADVTAPEWPQIFQQLAFVRPPATKPRAQTRVPTELRHLFWNTAAKQLDLDGSGGYIARRLIQIGDLDGLAWGAEQLSADDWRHAAATRGLTADRRALARNLAAASS